MHSQRVGGCLQCTYSMKACRYQWYSADHTHQPTSYPLYTMHITPHTHTHTQTYAYFHKYLYMYLCIHAHIETMHKGRAVAIVIMVVAVGWCFTSCYVAGTERNTIPEEAERRKIQHQNSDKIPTE